MGESDTWHWDSSDSVSYHHLEARVFKIYKKTDRFIPGVLWQSVGDSSTRRPLIFMQHGGSADKSAPSVLRVVETLVRTHDFRVVTIDGPIHGERSRVRSSGSAAELREAFLSFWRDENGVDRMVEDWTAVFEGICSLQEVDVSRLGWYGVSMGTAYGIPFLAHRPELKVAVLGKWSGDYPRSERVVLDAPKVNCAVLFVQRWNDELFSRAGTLDLFDRIGSKNKRLHAYPGSHMDSEGEPLDESLLFLAKNLS